MVRKQNYKCQVCAKTLKRSDNLKSHLKTVHCNFIEYLASQKYSSSFDVQLNRLQKIHLKDGKIDKDDVFDFESHVNRITKYFQKSKPQKRADEIQTNLEAQEILAENLLTSVIDDSIAQDEEDHSNFASPEIMPEERREHDVNKDSLSASVNVGEGSQCPEAPLLENKDHADVNRVDIIFEKVKKSKEKISKWSQSLFRFSCIACSVIQTCVSMLPTIIKAYVSMFCSHANKKSCCCSDSLQKAAEFTQNWSSFSTEGKPPDSDLESPAYRDMFFTKYVSKHEEKRYFCYACVKFSTKKRSWSKAGDFTFNGMKFTSARRKNEVMKRHFERVEHKKAMELMKHEKEKTILTEQTSAYENKCTENLLLAALFVTEQNLSTRFFARLCLFVDRIYDKFKDCTPVNPIGNRQHSTMALRKLQTAVYEGMVEELKSFLCENTKLNLPRKFVICADKGTAYNDASRQVVIATYIGRDGMPTESVLGAAAIRDATALGAKNNFKDCVTKFVDPKNVIAISTDGAAVYVGKHRGMYSLLVNDADFSEKLLNLPDVCHRTERWIKNNEPEWLSRTLIASQTLVGLIKQNTKLEEALNKVNAQDIEVKYYELKTLVKTRYAQFTYDHVMSILKNIEVICVVFQDLILSQDTDDSTKNLAKHILKTVLGPDLILNLLLVKNFFKAVAVMEKAAQSVTFGPFDYLENLRRMEQLLQSDLKIIPKECVNLQEVGVFEMKFISSGKLCAVKVNISEIRMNLELRAIQLRSVEEVSNLTTKYDKWISNLENDLDTYLPVLKPVETAVKAFTLTTGSNFSEKMMHVRKLFDLVNASFQSCSQGCLGSAECSCLEEEFKIFCDYIIEKDLVKEVSKNVTKAKKSCTETLVLAHFFNEKNLKDIKELKITNILKLIEVCLLMKASQSSTERAMSIIKTTVRGKFEKKFKFSSKEFDIVEAISMIRMNCELSCFNSSRALKKFYGSKHKSGLMKTKPLHTKSASVVRALGKAPKQKNKTQKKQSTKAKEVIAEFQGLLEEEEEILRMENEMSVTDLAAPEALREQVETTDDFEEVRPESTFEKREDFVYHDPETATGFARVPKGKPLFDSHDLNESSKVKSKEHSTKADSENGSTPKSHKRPAEIPSLQNERQCKKKKTVVKRGQRRYVDIKQSLPKEKSQMESIYCICKGTQENTDEEDLIGCKNESASCVSYRMRLREQNATGGDWFHKVCIGLNVSLDTTALDWACPKCDPLYSSLMVSLFNINRILKIIRGDGNCLYRALAYDKYGDAERHPEIRTDICMKLLELRESSQYETMWGPYHDRDDNIRLSEHQLVRDLARNFRAEFGVGEDDIISAEVVKAYVERKKFPAESFERGETAFPKYGTTIELAIYSLMEKKSVWYLTRDPKDATKYRWIFALGYTGVNSYEHNLKHSLCTTLLYENLSGNTDLAHYNVITPVKKLPPPKENSLVNVKVLY